MRFTPKTDEQFEKEDKERKEKFLWPKGTIVDYEITSAVNKMTKPKEGKEQREMIELSVQVYNAEGNKQTIMDWIGEWNLHKLKYICEANGMLAAYEAGEVNANDLYDKVGKAKLGIQKGGENPNGGNYPDKNTIDSFFKESTGAQPRQPVTQTKAEMENELNDEIPF